MDENHADCILRACDVHLLRTPEAPHYGVWDVVSDEEARELVLQHAHLSPNEIAEKLVQAALAGMSRDNISALVVRLQ